MLIVSFPFIACVIVTTVLPVASVVFIKIAQKRNCFSWGPNHPNSEKAPLNRSLSPAQKAIVIKVFCISIVFGLIKGYTPSFLFFETAAGTFDLFVSFILAGVFLCLVICIGNTFVKHFGYPWLYKLSIPIMICGLLLTVTTQSSAIASKGFLLLGTNCVVTMLWSFLSHITGGCRKRAVVVFSFGLSGLFFGSFIGAVTAHYLDTTFDPQTTLVTGPAVAILLLVLTYIFVPSGKEPGQSKGFAEDQSGKWRQRIDALAKDHNLTSREHEVFALLAKGQSAKKIQETLFISASTVNTHRYHIYEKLGVATKQELINYVEAPRRRGDEI
jgi:DNA-binding CsgD family transcriptional regulator